ncbi:L-rhamnose mutarotase [Pseudomonas asplenii]|uniref:L-rhamnose mutarotase n=1 Tax=Pseudomonas asplenii TaxID=53407 RepID=UPI0037C5E6E3
MKYCQVLDLKQDPALIAEYEAYHCAVWPEVLGHLRTAGIKDMTIWRYMNRLVMLIEADECVSFERMAAMEQSNPKIQEWEQLMWRFQLPVPGLPEGKWKLANEIFRLSNAIQSA